MTKDDPRPEPVADAVPGDGRAESTAERADRNWNDILQELRVSQTGTQILTGFLLTLAFQQRFTELDGYQRTIYLTLVLLGAIATALGLAPVVLHRVLFRQRAMEEVVGVADRLLRANIAGIALILVGSTLFIFDVVVGRAAGILAGCFALVLAVMLWIVLPFGTRRRRAAP